MYVEKAYRTLIAIRPSDGDVKPVGPLGAGTGFHVLPSFDHHPTQHDYTT